jgi:hypothetical protein
MQYAQADVPKWHVNRNLYSFLIVQITRGAAFFFSLSTLAE